MKFWSRKRTREQELLTLAEEQMIVQAKDAKRALQDFYKVLEEVAKESKTGEL
jgi:hypothetical protein